MYETHTPADVIARFAEWDLRWDPTSGLENSSAIIHSLPLLPSAPTLFNPYYYNVEGES
jgi:hypothetical protein